MLMTVLGFGCALVAGVVLAVFHISPVPPLHRLAVGYVAVFRNIPLLVWLVLFVFGLPEIGLLYPLFGTVTAAMALYWAAFICEAVRSGIRTVPPGQIEAARALGFGFSQLLRHLVLPQAVRSMVQPLGTVFIALTLNTSLAAAVGVRELTGETQFFTITYDIPIPAFAVTTAIYVLITLAGGLLTGRLERKLAFKR
ncbi:amino acid ABC transporter permease [Actinoallomurus spadix]|uniref:Amino acid ABC transporter permease n=2 Tax=Actinoallomurus spadix TaxID=79912 RepID=A0ABP3HEW4_9ACTN